MMSTPYDGTLFPRGILAPVLQWAPADGASVEAAYVHVKSKTFEYHGCFGPSDPELIPLPEALAAVPDRWLFGVGTKMSPVTSAAGLRRMADTWRRTPCIP